jgi:ethanolamine phosphate transferase 2 subunit G
MSPFLSSDLDIRQSPIDPLPSENEFTFYNKIQQSDLVPTISGLLGWTIPRNNIGLLLKSFLPLWNGAALLLSLY